MCSLYVHLDSEEQSSSRSYEGSIAGVGKVNKGGLPAWLVQWQEAEDW